MVGLLEVGEQDIELIEAAGPELPVAEKPPRCLPQPVRLDPAQPPLSVASPRDQAGPLQHLEVLGDRRLGHLERVRELLHRRLTRRQATEDRPSGGVGQGRERCVQVGHFITNQFHNCLVMYVDPRNPSTVRLPGSCWRTGCVSNPPKGMRRGKLRHTRANRREN